MEKVKSWKELSLREKIGQTVTITTTELYKQLENYESPAEFLEKYPLGGLFNSSRGQIVGFDLDSSANLADVMVECNNHLRVNLIGSGDVGRVARDHKFGKASQMAIGAADDDDISYLSGEIFAEDFKTSGIHWGFSPVIDLAYSMKSTLGSTRQISESPEQTIKIAKQQIQAMKDNGIIATIKHYPGGNVDNLVDAHLAPRDNDMPFEKWMATTGKVYKELIEAGVPTVMTGHTNLTDYQTEQVDGIWPAATFSKELVTKLLREELGFKGVVVTDALTMGGFGGEAGIERTIMSLEAGNDMLLWPDLRYFDELEKRILEGKFDEKILDAAVERIWKLKEEYGILDGRQVKFEKEDSYFIEKAKEINKKSLTLMNNYKNNFPIDKNKIKKILVIGVTPSDGEYEALTKLQDVLVEKGFEVDMERNVWVDHLQWKQPNYDLVIFAMSRSFHQPQGPLDFWGREAVSIWASNAGDANKIIIANFGAPYIYKYYEVSGLTYLNAYDCHEHTIRTFVDALLGEFTPTGKSPVKLTSK